MSIKRTLRFLSAADVQRALPMKEAIEVMKGRVPNFRQFDICHSLFEICGSPVAIMEGISLTAIRSGAASGAATDFLARKEVRKVAIFGAGIQARTQLEVMCDVRSIREASVFDQDRERAAVFSRETSANFGISVSLAATSAEALDGADIICTTTTSAMPVFSGSEVGIGTHINAIGSYKPHMREIPPETVTRSHVIEAAWKEAGDPIMPLQVGLIQANHIRAEIGEIAAGTKLGRTHPGLHSSSLWESSSRIWRRQAACWPMRRNLDLAQKYRCRRRG